MFALDKFSSTLASPLIVHSKSMKKTIEKRYKNKKIEIKIINSLSVPRKKIIKKVFSQKI